VIPHAAPTVLGLFVEATLPLLGFFFQAAATLLGLFVEATPTLLGFFLQATATLLRFFVYELWARSVHDPLVLVGHFLHHALIFAGFFL